MVKYSKKLMLVKRKVMRSYLLCLLTLCLASSSHTYKITTLPQHNTPLTFNRPTTFGKTHFIVGYQQGQDECTSWTPTATAKKNNKSRALEGQEVCDVFFSPDDDINVKLLSLIDQEKNHIRIAIFNFTNRNIAQALIHAQKRGVVVEVITDINCVYDRYNKIDQLHDNNISILVYNAKQSKTGSGIMHHKFALFSKNAADKALVWTGSCNFTRSGYHANQENAVLLGNTKIVNKFLKQFEHMKKQAHSYKPLFQQK